MDTDIIAIVGTLTPNSTSDEIRAAIHEIAKLPLDELSFEDAVEALAKASGRSVSAVRKLLLAAIAPPPRDPAILLAEATLEAVFGGQDHLKHMPDGVFFRYTDGHFSEATQEQVEGELHMVLAHHPELRGLKKSAVSTVSAAVKYLRSRCAITHDLIDSQPKTPVINLANGELWLHPDQPELRPHSANSNQTYRLPYAYDPDAECPVFIETLKGIFAKAAEPDEVVRHVEELLAYGMQSSRQIPTIVCLVGSGANGKTTILEALKLLLGSRRWYAATIQSLQRDRFVLSELVGRLAYIDDDVANEARLQEGILKSLAEGKRFTARRPYGRRSFDFEMRALTWMAMNSVPKINDTSHGFLRRLQVVPFERRFEPSEMDHSLTSKLENELDGIFSHLVHALYRLLKRGAFDPPAECIQARDRFLSEATIFRAYLAERTQPEADSRVRLQDMWEDLGRWCEDAGTKTPFTRYRLKSQLEGLEYQIIKSNGYPCVIDISLKPLA